VGVHKTLINDPRRRALPAAGLIETEPRSPVAAAMSRRMRSGHDSDVSSSASGYPCRTTPITDDLARAVAALILPGSPGRGQRRRCRRGRSDRRRNAIARVQRQPARDGHAERRGSGRGLGGDGSANAVVRGTCGSRGGCRANKRSCVALTTRWRAITTTCSLPPRLGTKRRNTGRFSTNPRVADPRSVT